MRHEQAILICFFDGSLRRVSCGDLGNGRNIKHESLSSLLHARLSSDLNWPRCKNALMLLKVRLFFFFFMILAMKLTYKIDSHNDRSF